MQPPKSDSQANLRAQGAAGCSGVGKGLRGRDETALRPRSAVGLGCRAGLWGHAWCGGRGQVPSSPHPQDTHTPHHPPVLVAAGWLQTKNSSG